MNGKIIALTGLALVAASAFGDVDLWNQQDGSIFSSGSAPLDMDATDTPSLTFTTYQLSDVEVGATGWNVDQMSMLVYITSGTNPLSLNDAVLNVFANTTNATTPGSDNPLGGQDVDALGATVSTTFVSGTEYLMTVSGLNLHWAAGQYWIGLTAKGSGTGVGFVEDAFSAQGAGGANPAGALNQSFWDNTGGILGVSGWNSYSAYPIGSFPPGYAAIDIRGLSTPEPASLTILGLGALGVIRRRRRSKN